MIRLIAVVAILYLSGCHGFQEFLEDQKNINTAAGLQCSRLEGSASECLECYPCSHDRVKNTPEKQFHLTLSYSNCTKEQLCCLKANEFKARSNDGHCGKPNPRGNPPSRRAALRSVLEREYPWRAWVYSAVTNQPLCAASYVYFNVFALVTTASCVQSYQPRDLYVKFTKTQATPDAIREVILHPNYYEATGGNIDDIALLTLQKRPDSKVVPVCIDKQPVVHGSSSCVVVSDSETFVNTIVPPLKKCETDKVNLENSVMCSYLVEGDYVPQPGAGLYCVEGHAKSGDQIYVLYGIYQGSMDGKQVALYTAMDKFAEWVFKTTEGIKKAMTDRS